MYLLRQQNAEATCTDQAAWQRSQRLQYSTAMAGRTEAMMVLLVMFLCSREYRLVRTAAIERSVYCWCCRAEPARNRRFCAPG
eukprot:COSAG02_NODE_792_length_17157_cov_6.602122_6_plen_83_part_00